MNLACPRVAKLEREIPYGKSTNLMKQVLQHLRTGEMELAELPCPQVGRGQLLIQTRASLISAGTERMLVEFSQANLIQKTRQQPDKVLQVLEKVKTDGLFPAMEAVKSKLDQPLPLGYCNVGEVIEVGGGVEGFQVGDRVVSNGPHAEVVLVPVNLCAKVPEGVSDDEAVFTVLGAIALQGIRLIQPTLGESFVVTGLGLVGLLTVQLLKAQGCRVLGLDLDSARVELAKAYGADTVDLSRGEDPMAAARAFSRGWGVDGVIITASTKSNEPIHQAAQICRKKGRIVLIGVVGLELSRTDFYEKELSFQVSCSYGPGRYDPAYEGQGHDYPIGYVRWTEQRNFEAVLDMLAENHLKTGPLISHHFPLGEAARAYDLIGGSEPVLGILLTYDEAAKATFDRTIEITPEAVPVASTPTGLVLGMIGAGNYAIRTLIPAFKKAGVRLKTVASGGDATGAYAGRKFGFEAATTDTESLLADPDINAVAIATRHDSHARFVCQALQAGKHVFVEKPLAITRDELREIESTYGRMQSGGQALLLMVDFNRRFAPHIRKMKELLEGVREPKSIVMTVNAGEIPPDDWTQDPAVGGGRIIGEGCHFIDLLRFLVGEPVVSVQTTMMGDAPGVTIRDDKVSFTLGFADGSFGTVHYLANGHRSFPKERLEVFTGGKILQLDNFRRLRGYGWKGFRKLNLRRQDKGNTQSVVAFLDTIRRSGSLPIPFDEIVEATRISLEITQQVR